MLGKDEESVSEQMNDVLAQVSKYSRKLSRCNFSVLHVNQYIAKRSIDEIKDCHQLRSVVLMHHQSIMYMHAQARTINLRLCCLRKWTVDVLGLLFLFRLQQTQKLVKMLEMPSCMRQF